EIIEAVYAQTEGNPLFMTEVVRLLDDEGVLRGDATSAEQRRKMRIPEGVREVIGRRLDRLSDRCNETLTVASVIGRVFTLDALDHLVEEQSNDQLLEVMDEALGAKLVEELPRSVGRYQFTHALVQETLAAELSTTRRGRLHARIGQVFEELYADNLPAFLGQLAYHFVEAANAGDPAKAVDYCQRAGDSAMAHVAYEEAARLYEMALQALEGPESMEDGTRAKLLLDLGLAQVKANDFASAIETLGRAAKATKEVGDDESFARAAIGIAEAHWRPGVPAGPAVTLMEEALEALPKRDSSLRALALGGLARLKLYDEATQERAREVGEEAVAMARRLDDPATLALAFRTAGYINSMGMGLENWVVKGDDRAIQDEMIALAEQLGDLDTYLEVYSWRVGDLMEQGDRVGLTEAVAAMAEVVNDYRVPHFLYLVALWKVTIAMLDGRFDVAETASHEALEVGQRLRSEGVEGTFGLHMFAISKERGTLGEVEPVLKMFIEQHAESTTWRPGLAIIYSEMDRTEDARGAFELLAAQDFTDIPRDTMWIATMAFLAEVCAYLRDATRAETLYEMLLPWDGKNVLGGFALCYGPVARFLGLLAATMSRWEEGEGHFKSALEMSGRMSSKPWLTHIQVDYAEMLLGRAGPGDEGRAAQLLDEAADIAGKLGMSSLRDRATVRRQALKV
ncbi:MAG: hypothetical protein V3S98_07845, partial [Dehalococcoidia bacterium]